MVTVRAEWPRDLVLLEVGAVEAEASARGCGWFAVEELTERERLATAKRRAEWTAGRLAAKRAVQRATGLPLSRLVIRRSARSGNRGQPEVFLDGGARLPGFLSITHAGGFAAATYSPTAVGLDLEALIEPAPAFIETVFAPAIARRLLALATPARALETTRAWCAKEAYAKWLGRGFALPLMDLDPHRDPRVRVEHGCLPGPSMMVWARAVSAGVGGARP